MILVVVSMETTPPFFDESAVCVGTISAAANNGDVSPTVTQQSFAKTRDQPAAADRADNSVRLFPLRRQLVNNRRDSMPQDRVFVRRDMRITALLCKLRRAFIRIVPSVSDRFDRLSG